MESYRLHPFQRWYRSPGARWRSASAGMGDSFEAIVIQVSYNAMLQAKMFRMSCDPTSVCEHLIRGHFICVRLSSCNTEQLTSVATEVGRLHKKSHHLERQYPAPSSARETPGYLFVTGKEAAEIVRLYATGITATDVSERTGRPLRTVTDVLRRHGVEIRKQFSRVDMDSSEIERLYRAGWSIRKIAEKMGVGKSTVGKHLTSAGVTLRSKSEAARLRRKRDDTQPEWQYRSPER